MTPNPSTIKQTNKQTNSCFRKKGLERQCDMYYMNFNISFRPKPANETFLCAANFG